MGEGLAFVAAATAVMGSPGPATVSIAAVASSAGWRRALPFALGMIVGTLGVLMLIVAGLLGVVSAVPGLLPALSLAAVAYILYLAYRIGTSVPNAPAELGGPVPGFVNALPVGLLNPKAYFALAAVFTGTGLDDDSLLAEPAFRLLAMIVLIFATHLVWLAAGTAMSRLARDRRRARRLNVTMALVLVASCIPIASDLI